MTTSPARALVILSLVVAACSSSGRPADAGGAAGSGAGGVGGSVPEGGRGGGDGGRGGSGGQGGDSSCRPPVPSNSNSGCAATYDEQAKRAASIKGACGDLWGWFYASAFVLTCIYDADKNLIADRYCEDFGPTCRESCPSVADFGTCIEDIGRPATGCAAAGSDAGITCCGDGTLPPSGPPFFCAPTYAEQRGARCRTTGTCGGFLITADYGLYYSIRCYYSPNGSLAYAIRSDSPTALYCGASTIRSALATDAGVNDPNCDAVGSFSETCGPTDAGAGN